MAQRVGLWIIGARGGVASVACTGLLALQKEIVAPIALTTELPLFQNLGLVDWRDIVIGGCEIRDTSLGEEVREFVRNSRAFDSTLIDQVSAGLSETDNRISEGILANAGKAIESLASDRIARSKASPAEKIGLVRRALESFRKNNQLERVVVFNLASTEPPVESPIPGEWRQVQQMLDSRDCPLPSSSLYAIAAFQAGCAYVNFTPSTGSTPPALAELALQCNAVHAGCDGKTGETLLKSALAPAFAIRNLEVMSWVGHNIFGNRDGLVLDDPANKKTKVASKDRLLGEILGYSPQTHISIEYIESLGDWKTAWDHIHFRGFLGTPMTMQFTWQGCDSILAAPLVLDLFRLTERAMRTGAKGPLAWLACFFKSPLGTSENDLSAQFRQLAEWAATVGKSPSGVCEAG
jgi:myo-inositol-1-phosphate synthase